MATSPDLGIPYIANQQAQPEVTHNEALNMVAALLNGAVTLGDDAPPVSPTEGDIYIVGTAPTGDWAGQTNKIAMFVGGAWLFVPGVDSDGTAIDMSARQAGITIYVRDDDLTYRWSGSAWAAIEVPAENISYDAPAGGYAHNVKQALDELYGLAGA